MARREYPARIYFNGRWFSAIVIDSHYEIKHPDMSDAIILKLVSNLDQEEAEAIESKSGFEYFVFEKYLSDKLYRLIITIPLDGDYIGVVNAFRSKKRR